MIEYVLQLVIMLGIIGLLVLVANLLLGSAGLLHLGIAALFGVGAYGVVLFSLLGVPLWLAVILAILLTVVVSVVLAARVRGEYVAIVTLVFGLLFESFVFWLRPGGFVLERMSWLSSPWVFCLLVLMLLVLVYVVVARFVRSPFGRLLRGIRDDAIASVAVGKNVVRARLAVFALFGFVAGIAGVLFSQFLLVVDASSFGVSESLLLVAVVVIGGADRLWGSLAAVVLLVGVVEVLRFIGLPLVLISGLRQVLFAVLVLVVLRYRSEGLFGGIR